MSKSKRSPVSSRVLAAAALLCGFAVVVAVVVGSLGGGGGSSSNGRAGGHPAQHPTRTKPRHVPKVYVVQSGDTLTSIAHKTGITVARIRALNPGIDPQILISGETLKLR